MVRSHVVDGVAGREFFVTAIGKVWKRRGGIVTVITVLVVFSVKLDVVALLNVLENRRRHVSLILMLMKVRCIGDVRIWKWIW